MKILLIGIENSALWIASLTEFPSPPEVILTCVNFPFTGTFSVVLYAVHCTEFVASFNTNCALDSFSVLV